MTYWELDLLDFGTVARFIHQHKINVANLTYVLYELDVAKRSAIVELLARELYPPSVLLRFGTAQGTALHGVPSSSFFHNGQTTPQTLCFVTDGHYKGYVLPLEDYEPFTRNYPIAYELSYGAEARPVRLARKERHAAGDIDGFSLRGVMPPWLATLIGVAGSALGFASNLYADSFRNAITTVTQHGWLVILPLSSVDSGKCSVLPLYRWQLRRRQELTGVSGPAAHRCGCP